METIPPPEGGRQYTAWADYADGQWHLARQGEDYTGTPENWTRAGRAWGKRHGYTAQMLIEGTDVRLVFAEEGDEGVPAPSRPPLAAVPEARPQDVEPTAPEVELSPAQAAWRAATAAFFSDAPPPELRLRPLDPDPEAA
jgi:hypothetical protein